MSIPPLNQQKPLLRLILYVLFAIQPLIKISIKLDSIDAYERKLVKQIEVASIAVKDGYNKSYIRLISVDNKKSPIIAQIEFDASQKGVTKRVTKKVRSGDDLLALSGGRSVYDGYVINDIVCEPENEYIDFTSKPEVIRLNEVIGDVHPDELKRLQIRKTIEEHLQKELKLTSRGIKVLSLFFIAIMMKKAMLKKVNMP